MTTGKKKSDKKTSKADYKKSIKNLSKNYWVVSTVVLSILLVVSIVILSNGLSGAVVSPQQAGQNVLVFAKNQGANVTLVNSSDDGSLYKVILSIKGKNGMQEVPVYVTKDGKTLVPQPIPLTTKKTESKTSTSKATATVNIPKSNKPKVELFVMAYCPYGTQMEKGILPVVKTLGDKINFTIKFVYYSMHTSHGEIPEQLNQYCIQKEQNSKYLNYLTCFLEAGDSKGCMDKVGIDKTELSTCASATDKKYNVMANLKDKSSWLNGQFPRFDVYKADNVKYKVAGSPTLVIDGVKVSSGRDSASLMKTICGAFNVAPSECNTKFKSGTPSPGFGFGTAASENNAAAGCGA